jgi:hypothetical protein
LVGLAEEKSWNFLRRNGDGEIADHLASVEDFIRAWRLMMPRGNAGEETHSPAGKRSPLHRHRKSMPNFRPVCPGFFIAATPGRGFFSR